MSTPRRLIVLDLQSMDAPIVAFEEFIRANADAADIVERAAALAPCQGFIVGGGAAPAFAITRID